MRLVLLLILSFAFGCETVEKDHAQLSRQRLAMRPDFQGYLTNRICEKKDFWGNCEKYSIKQYDLGDPEIRKMINDFKIACKIGGKRFRVSLDRPGFERRSKGECLDRKLFSRECKDWETIIDFISITEHDYLVEAQTQCKSGW